MSIPQAREKKKLMTSDKTTNLVLSEGVNEQQNDGATEIARYERVVALFGYIFDPVTFEHEVETWKYKALPPTLTK